jgi:hypothetical protein
MKLSTIAWSLGAAAVAGLTACGGSDDDSPPPVSTQAACDAMSGKSIAGSTVTGATLVAATATVPEYCKVTALIAPKLNFEVRMPSEWNGKMHYSGGGGFNGSISPIDARAVTEGYVNVASDSGHTAAGTLDASFAFNDPTALELFGPLSVPTVAAATKEIIKTRYGTMPTRSYFQGCSTGGREGLSVALRFPTMFDGVIAGAPARQYAPTYAHTQRTLKLLAAPGGAVSPAKSLLVSQAVLAACDTVAADGVVDGVVSNPQACNFDPHTLRCPGGADTGDTCLSDAQIAVLDAHTSPNTTANGALSYAGFPYSGMESPQWDAWILGTPSIHFLFALTSVRNLLAKDLNADPMTYDYNANAGVVQAVSSIIDVTDSNLSRFASVGGKIITYHGWGDAAVTPRQSADYYNGMVASAGGRSQADAFARYYVLPGVGHCAGGPGADDLGDMLPALDKWVTAGTAPDAMVAKKLNATTGATEMSRPLCAYPKYSRYNGSGDPNAASSYTCTTP